LLAVFPPAVFPPSVVLAVVLAVVAWDRIQRSRSRYPWAVAGKA